MTLQVGRVHGALLTTRFRHPPKQAVPGWLGPAGASPAPPRFGPGEPAHLVLPLKLITVPDDAGTWSPARGLSKENSA